MKLRAINPRTKEIKTTCGQKNRECTCTTQYMSLFEG